jgi:hypothetical protein
LPATAPPPIKQPLAMPARGSEIDDGVIEEARRRQRRRQRGVWTAIVAAAAACVGLLLGTTGAGTTTPAGHAAAQLPQLRLAFVHGRPYVNGQPFVVSVTPSLRAGNVGMCVSAEGGGGCPTSYAGPGRPLYGAEGTQGDGKVGPQGEIDYILTRPGVAAVRVKHTGTFKPIDLPGLPSGDRAVVFYRSPGSIGTVVPPEAARDFEQSHPPSTAITLTPLDPHGHPIPQRAGHMFQLPSRYWQQPAAPPAKASCALTSSLGQVSGAWGEVAMKIAPDTAVTGAAFLTCLETWYHHDGASLQAALLLNAQTPGRPPAPLWNVTPLTGHPGVVQIHGIYRRWNLTPAELKQRRREHPGAATFIETTLEPPAVARRDGNAWLLVRYGRTLAERVRFLKSLHATFTRCSPRCPSAAR